MHQINEQNLAWTPRFNPKFIGTAVRAFGRGYVHLPEPQRRALLQGRRALSLNPATDLSVPRDGTRVLRSIDAIETFFAPMRRARSGLEKRRAGKKIAYTTSSAPVLAVGNMLSSASVSYPAAGAHV